MIDAVEDWKLSREELGDGFFGLDVDILVHEEAFTFRFGRASHFIERGDTLLTRTETLDPFFDIRLG